MAIRFSETFSRAPPGRAVRLAAMRISTIVLVAVGCAGGPTGGTPSNDAAPGRDAPADGATTCAEPPTCTAWNVASSCGVATVCPAGCFAGACSASACADECGLGETGATGTCALWSMSAAAFVPADPAGSLHDRARDYDRLERVDHMPEGGILATIYTAPDLHTLAAYDGITDSALWTGTLLAAQSWRLLATGARDAADRVAALVRTLHVWLNVGSPGYLARFAVPEADATGPYGVTDCTHEGVHCGAVVDNVTYRWRGDTSRDQYTGTMLGLMYAYLASPDAGVRALIREDVVRFVEQLMIERQNVPVHLSFNGLPIDTTMTSKFLILAPEEMTANAVTLTIDLATFDISELGGAREFVPDFGPLLGQLVGISLPIARPGSAMMLGAFYRMALAMTDGVPSMAARRAAIQADYDTEYAQLESLAAQWSYTQTCGAKYYATHIELIMGYLWTVLETDPARKAQLQTDVMGALWNVVGSHDNVYFAFLNAGSRGGFASEAAAAASQLAQFQPGPRVVVPRDHVAEYPHDAACTSDGKPMASTAVSVGDRVVADFLWQRNPWKLWDAGNPVEVMAGVDYLAAYWAGRYHGFVMDDRPGTCARWSP